MAVTAEVSEQTVTGRRVLGPDASAKQAIAILKHIVEVTPGTQTRPQQVEMTDLVARTASTGDALIVQAGTGTGKSLAYLSGGVGAGARMVVSTATRQLSDQLLASDVPLVLAAARKIRRRNLSAVSLKGRSNYLCLAKVAEVVGLDERAPAPMPEAELDLGIDIPPPVEEKKIIKPTSAEVRALQDVLAWAQESPDTGDRTEAPDVSDRVWSQVSMDAASCPGARLCAFGEQCFTEQARAAARVADVVVINHALLAQDLVSPNPIFDDVDLVVVDEVHELEGYLTSAWGHEIFAGAVERTINAAARRIPKTEERAATLASQALEDVAALVDALHDVEIKTWEQEFPPLLDGPLVALEQRAVELAAAMDGLAKQAAEGQSALIQSSRQALIELVEDIRAVRKADPKMVRWSESGRDENPSQVRAAPLDVGRTFRERIGSRALVATSATASLAGDFTPVANMLGLTLTGLTDELGEPLSDVWSGVDVGSPFDYQKQGILYVPSHLPEPVGKERADHTAAVLDELLELTQSAGGRTLALFTTTAAARNAGEFLRKRLKVTVLTHGELPAAALAEEFALDETSVLCATMGMWAGLNIPGSACTLVVIDKIPFAPMDDPLAAARRKKVDESGGSGFREVFVNQASLLLTQGAGRLIRTTTDKGMVAILDPRLLSKGYGTLMLRSLPPMWQTSDPTVARAALARLAADAAALSR